MCATAGPLPTNPTQSPAVDKRAAREAARAALTRRRQYDRRLRVLLNRQDFAARNRDRALDRLDAIEREIAALDAWFLGGDLAASYLGGEA